MNPVGLQRFEYNSSSLKAVTLPNPDSYSFLLKPEELEPATTKSININLQNLGNECWVNSAIKFLAKTDFLDAHFDLDIEALIQKKITIRKNNSVAGQETRQKDIEETFPKLKSFIHENPDFSERVVEKDQLEKLITWSRILKLEYLELELNKIKKGQPTDLTEEKLFEILFNFDPQTAFEKAEAEEKIKCDQYIRDLENKKDSIKNLHQYIFATIQYLRVGNEENPNQITEMKMLKDKLLLSFRDCFDLEKEEGMEFDSWEFIYKISTFFGENPDSIYSTTKPLDLAFKKLDSTLGQDLYLLRQMNSSELQTLDQLETDSGREYQVQSAVIYIILDNGRAHYMFMERCLENSEFFLLHDDHNILHISSKAFMNYLKNACLIHLKQTASIESPLLKSSIVFKEVTIKKQPYIKQLIESYQIDKKFMSFFMRPSTLTPIPQNGIRCCIPANTQFKKLATFLQFAAASGIVDSLFYLPIKNEQIDAIHHLLFAIIETFRQPPKMEENNFYLNPNLEVILDVFMTELNRIEGFNSFKEKFSPIYFYQAIANIFGVKQNENCLYINQDTYTEDLFNKIPLPNQPESLYVNLYSRQPQRRLLKLSESGTILIADQLYIIQSLLVCGIEHGSSFTVMENVEINPNTNYALMHAEQEPKDIYHHEFIRMAGISHLMHLKKIS